MRQFCKGWGKKLSVLSVVMACMTIGGCTSYYKITVSGVVISEDGKLLYDVMISRNANGPGPTEKWSGLDGTFTPWDLKFSDQDFDGGKLPSASLWFVKEGYETKKVEVHFPRKPQSYSDAHKIRLEITLKRIV